MEIKIETKQPPKERPKFKEKLDQLEVGANNTFRVELEHWSALRNAAGNANRKTNRTFTVHKVKERGSDRKYTEFARVWRVK
jgi:hypothetical protein